MKDRSKLISEAGEDYHLLDGSIRKRVAKKIDELSESLYLAKPFNLAGINLIKRRIKKTTDSNEPFCLHLTEKLIFQ